MLVLLTSAGIGSRLKPYTDYINKGLLPFKNKPALLNIINNYPKNTKFILCVGYLQESILDFIKIADLNHRVKIIKIDNFDEKNGSLTYTLKKAMKNINEPFIFHSNDSMTERILIKNCKKNLIFINNKSVKNQIYRKVSISDRYNINKFYSKSYQNQNLKLYDYIGITYIYEYDKFKKFINNYNKKDGESGFIKKFSNTFKIYKIKKWVDIGNIKDFENNAYLNYNVLPKKDQHIYFFNNKVLKFFNDRKKIKNLKIKSKFFKKITPILIKHSNNFVGYNYINGEIFNKQRKINLKKLLLFFKKEIWNKKTKIVNKKKFKEELNKFYFIKSINRIDEYINNNKKFCDFLYINNIKVDNIKNIIKKINWKNLSNSIPTYMHGDLHFENILISKNKIIALDIRNDFSKFKFLGDMYYDLSKILHGIIVNHEIVNQNYFKYKKNNKSIKINIRVTKNFNNNLKIFYEYCKKENYNIKKIEIICALIYLNIACLHHHPYSHFLFCLGNLMLHFNLNTNRTLLNYIYDISLIKNGKNDTKTMGK
tara:strand:+ start:1067 stop:2686 length:1620 start_codon:yes stop_codon:yes gene_type:complete